MNRNITRSALLVLSIATLHVSLAPTVRAQNNSCSTAKAAGEWGFTLSGTILLPTGPIPAAGVVRATIDAQGNGTGSEPRNVGGGFAKETFTSTWTVDSDCTGTLTVNAYESGVLVRTSVLSIVFVDNLNKALMVQESLTLPDGTVVPAVITAEGERMFPQSSNQQ